MPTLTEAPPQTLTYEAYMAEPITEGRYDIINGVRIFMPGGTYGDTSELLATLKSACFRDV